jgi:hypothetical protein
VKGDDLGIVLNTLTKEPVQGENNNIDIVNTNNDFNIIIDNTFD